MPRILEVFAEFQMAATWATVGFLFARDRTELASAHPELKPTFSNPAFNPYSQQVGPSETEDPLHFAYSLLELIRQTPRQEIGSHTYCHYHVLEPGQTLEQFRADLQAATTVARKMDVTLQSMAFPNNQVNQSYLPELPQLGISSYRGPERNWGYVNGPQSILRRVYRWLDSHFDFSGPNLTRWQDLKSAGLPYNIPSSRFLRPYHRLNWLNRRQLERIKKSMSTAGAQGAVFHLWWHPHNFGVSLEANIQNLRELLKHFQHCQDTWNMRSLSMSEVSQQLDLL